MASTQHAAKRFAHPFFVPAPPTQRAPIHGVTRMVDWSKQHLGPLPPIARDGRIALADVIGAEGVKEIVDVGEIRFQALGDSGAGNAHEAELIGDEMATDYRVGAGGLNPAFLFHLGDVVYGPGKDSHYAERF
ncbi:MAG TPA: metallophosphoesterase, partial [Thermoanaerobaculia bacterium]